MHTILPLEVVDQKNFAAEFYYLKVRNPNTFQLKLFNYFEQFYHKLNENSKIKRDFRMMGHFGTK